MGAAAERERVGVENGFNSVTYLFFTMDELAILRGKLADLESKLEEANERKMPSVTNEWIVAECRKSINKIDRARQLYLDKHKVTLAAAEERIMDCRITVPPNESIMTPLSRHIMTNPKGPWRVQYQLWDGTSMGMSVPQPEGEQIYACEFVKRMVNKYHSDMLKKTFPTATWECQGGSGPIIIWVTFPNPVDSMDEYKTPLLH
jgi:hypothetical protein